MASLTLIAARGAKARARLRQPIGAWLLGFTGLFGYHALYFFALSHAPVAAASLICYLWPLLIVMFARPSAPGLAARTRQLGGASLGLAGTALIVLGRPGAGLPETMPIAGFLAALCAAFVWAGYSVLNRRYAARGSEPIGVLCAAVALTAGLCHWLFEPHITPEPRQFLALAALGLGPVGLAFFAWDHATKHGNLPLLGALSYFAPLLSTLLLVLTSAASLQASLIGAAALIVTGASLARR